MLEVSLEASVEVSPVDNEPVKRAPPPAGAKNVRIPAVGEARDWGLLSCVVVASGNKPAAYEFDGTQVLLMHAAEKSWGKNLLNPSAPMTVTVDPSVPSAKTPFGDMLQPYHPPGPFVLYECVLKE